MIRSVRPFTRNSIPACSISERRSKHSFETKRIRTRLTCRHSLRRSTFFEFRATSDVIFADTIIINHLHCMNIFYNVKSVWASSLTLVVRCVTTKLLQSTHDDRFLNPICRTHRKLEPTPCCKFQNRMNLVVHSMISTVKITTLHCTKMAKHTEPMFTAKDVEEGVQRNN